MQQQESQAAARLFVERWTGHGNERSDTSKFWNELLEEVLGVDKAFKLFRYEERVKLDHASFYDVFIPSTHVLIEQKSLHVDLVASHP